MPDALKSAGLREIEDNCQCILLGIAASSERHLVAERICGSTATLKGWA